MCNCFYAFSCTYKEEKVLFWVQIFEKDILMDLHVLKVPESKYHILRSWRVSIMSITLNQITTETSNFVFTFVQHVDVTKNFS